MELPLIPQSFNFSKQLDVGVCNVQPLEAFHCRLESFDGIIACLRLGEDFQMTVDVGLLLLKTADTFFKGLCVTLEVAVGALVSSFSSCQLLQREPSTCILG